MTDWPSVPMRRVASLAYGESLAGDVRQPGDVEVFGSNGAVGAHDRSNTRSPAVIVGRKGSFGKVHYSPRPVFAIDTTYFIDGSQTTANLRWLYYALSSLGLDGLSEDVGVPGLSRERVYDQRLLYPPRATQRVIADYLDREMARIDALIAAKRRMVVLLEERLAVSTRQILMSSGYPMLPLKRTWRIVDCKHRTPIYSSTGYPVISPGDATPGRLDLSRAHRFVDEPAFRDLTADGRKPVKGDVIYSRNASIGIAAFVDTDRPFCMGQDVCLISSDEASQLFLTYCLNTLGKDQLEEQKIGSTFSRVNISQILELIVPTPAPEEQRQIAQQLDKGASLHQMTVIRLEDQIDLLEERRQSLITAAVAGQLDVPEAA